MFNGNKRNVLYIRSVWILYIISAESIRSHYLNRNVQKLIEHNRFFFRNSGYLEHIQVNKIEQIVSIQNTNNDGKKTYIQLGRSTRNKWKSLSVGCYYATKPSIRGWCKITSSKHRRQVHHPCIAYCVSLSLQALESHDSFSASRADSDCLKPLPIHHLLIHKYI